MQGNKDLIKKLHYFQCPKGGFHQGEILNIICTESGCQSKLLCCNVCISEDHKKHVTKSLKLFLSESKKAIENVNKVNINSDIIMQMIEQNRTKHLQKLKDIREFTIGIMDNMQKEIEIYYKQIIAKIKVLTTSSMNEIMIQILEEIYKKTTPSELMREIQRIISYLPKDNGPRQSEFNQELLIQSLKNNYQDIDGVLGKVSLQNKNLFKILKSKINASQLFAQKKFRFSEALKHPNIQLINPTTVKSTGESGYKFCILQPTLETTGNNSIKDYSFKIKQNSASNWIALGMCHKQIITKNDYGFSYYNLGHGAYMVSSNAGSWSSIQTDKNNVVKAFYFYKNDIIHIKVDFIESIINFSKKGSDIVYSLKFTTIPDDPLYPCVLFYFENDEVEYFQTEQIEDA